MPRRFSLERRCSGRLAGLGPFELATAGLLLVIGDPAIWLCCRRSNRMNLLAFASMISTYGRRSWSSDWAFCDRLPLNLCLSSEIMGHGSCNKCYRRASFNKIKERRGMLPMNKILAINPGSTSTKIAVFEGETKVVFPKMSHTMPKAERIPGNQ